MAEQMSFGFEDEDLTAFLGQLNAIEDDEDRLREHKRLLVEEYKDKLPMRWVRTALKVVRAMRKLEQHTKEPLARREQDYLIGEVERALEVLEREKLDAAHAVPTMF